MWNVFSSNSVECVYWICWYNVFVEYDCWMCLLNVIVEYAGWMCLLNVLVDCVCWICWLNVFVYWMWLLNVFVECDCRLTTCWPSEDETNATSAILEYGRTGSRCWPSGHCFRQRPTSSHATDFCCCCSKHAVAPPWHGKYAKEEQSFTWWCCAAFVRIKYCGRCCCFLHSLHYCYTSGMVLLGPDSNTYVDVFCRSIVKHCIIWASTV